MSQGWGLVPSLAAAIAIGLLIGAIQGALVAYVNIPAFIVTLGGLEAWRGVILKLTKGATIPVELPFFRSLGRDFIDPRIGFGLAIAGIAAIVWTNIRRNRARQRHGLKALSSGAIAAFMVAWERPNEFRKVFSNVGSFTDIRGGYVYPERVLA